MAWTASWTPLAAARAASARTSSTGAVLSPVLDGRSLYGASSHAPREPIAPSMVFLIAAMVRYPSARPTALYDAILAAMFSLVSRTITQSRTPNAPDAAACFSRSMVAKLSPASWIVVMPLRRASSTASSMVRLASSACSSGVRLASQSAIARLARSDAVSRSRPVGRPDGSFRISPPGGFRVAAVMPAASSARALTNPAWPLACSRNTGLFGDTRLSESCSGNPSTFGFGGAVHFS